MGQTTDWKNIVHALEKGKKETILNLLNQYLQKYPDDLQAYLLRIQMLEEDSRQKWRYKLFEDSKAVLSLATVDASLMLKFAAFARECHAYFDEMDLYGQLIQHFPDEPEYLKLRLECRVRNFKEPKAFILDDIDLLRELGALEPWMTELENELIFKLSTEVEKHLLDLKLMLSQGRSIAATERVMTLLTKAYWSLAEYEHADEYLHRLKQINPENPMILIFVGRLLGSQERTLESVECLAEAYSDLAKYLELELEPFEMREYYRTAIELNPKFFPAYLRLADYLSEHEFDSAAIKYLTKLIEFSPDTLEHYQTRAFHAGMCGDWEMVIADCGQIIRLEPENIQAYYQRQEAYFELQDYEKALADIDQVICFGPAQMKAANIEDAHSIRSKIASLLEMGMT